MMGMPERSTILAASGSTQKLNSAAGVMLPAPSGRPPIGSAHDDDLLDLRAEPGSVTQRHGDVGQRADRHDRDLAGPRLHRVDDELAAPTSRPSSWRSRPAAWRRWRRRTTTKPCWYSARTRSSRAPAACRHPDRRADLFALGDLEHPQHIRCPLLERPVARHRGDAEDLELRRVERQHQRVGCRPAEREPKSVSKMIWHRSSASAEVASARAQQHERRRDGRETTPPRSHAALARRRLVGARDGAPGRSCSR